MTGPTNTREHNPITINVAIMFLFYVLTVSICLSSVSTCVCVIFNPLSTFRTIANYLFYALGFSVLLTLLFVALICVGFIGRALPGSKKATDVGDEKRVLGEHLKLSTTAGLFDAVPISKGYWQGLAPRKAGEAMVAHEVHHEGSEKPTGLVHRTECGGVNRVSRKPHDSGQVTVIRGLINADASTEKPIARNDGTRPSTPVAEASKQTALQDDSTSWSIKTMTVADETLYSCEEISAILDKMINEDEPKEKAPGIKAGKTSETPSYGKATDNILASHEFKKTGKAMRPINLTDISATNISCGISRGDTAIDESPSKEKVGMMVERYD